MSFFIKHSTDYMLAANEKIVFAPAHCNWALDGTQNRKNYISRAKLPFKFHSVYLLTLTLYMCLRIVWDIFITWERAVGQNVEWSNPRIPPFDDFVRESVNLAENAVKFALTQRADWMWWIAWLLQPLIHPYQRPNHRKDHCGNSKKKKKGSTLPTSVVPTISYY